MSRFVIGVNDLATRNPELAAQWHPTNNGDLTPSDVGQFSNRKVWWLGKCGHEWQANVGNRARGIGCPVCNGKLVLPGCNDLATIHPELAAEWHPTKNGNLTPEEVTARANRKVWWIGKCGHEWEAIIANRSTGVGCPVCAGKKVLQGFNDLASAYPTLAAEWHPTKNEDLTPSRVSCGSNKKVWWQCSICGHEWQARIADRAGLGRTCSCCSGGKRKL